MASVSVNPPRTPVTKGSSGIAMATLPNMCKMPGPPPPFVPTPLPNIGKSGDSPKGYSKKVKVEGQFVAIKGASFGSMGDAASKGTGGGLVSMNTHGPTKFIGPGSLDVKIEGKNVQYLGDPMMNNCGPSGSPANSATLLGVLQAPSPPLLSNEDKAIICEDFCKCQAAYLDGEISGSGCCSSCLQKKLEERALPHIHAEQSYLFPRDGGAPQLLTPSTFEAACQPLRGTRTLNFVSGLLAGGLPVSAGGSVTSSAAIRLSRGLNTLSKTLSSAGSPAFLGRVVRPDVVVHTSNGPLVAEAKFTQRSGRVDPWGQTQLDDYRNIGPVTEINAKGCGC